MTDQKILENIYSEIFIESNLNRILDHHTKNGFIIITSYRNEKNDKLNKKDFHALKIIVQESGYSYIPVYGGFIENKNTPEERIIQEPALFIPNRVVHSDRAEEDKLVEFGMMLCDYYDQESFFYQPENSDKAYYLDKDGNTDATFTGKTVNDLTQIYFTDLSQKAYERNKRDKGFGKSLKRFTFK
jgi:hypothetical protein